MIESVQDIEILVHAIRSGKTGRDRVIKELYYNQSLRSMIRGLLNKHGARHDDFDDIFNTTLMQFVKSVISNKDLVIKSSIEHYILGISKYVWYGELRKRKNHRSEDIEEQLNISDGINPEQIIIDHDQKELISELLNYVGKNCREVLMYWAHKYSMAEIADKLEYKSEGMAKKKKYVCLKQLLLYVDKNPHVKSLLNHD